MTLMIRQFGCWDGVHAIRISPHFAVHQTPYNTGNTYAHRWSATHIASGFSLISEVPLAVAVAAAIELEPLCDWDFTDEVNGRALNGARWSKCHAIRERWKEDRT